MTMTAILTNCPDEATADAIAEGLILSRLVACANRYAPIRSLFHWQGAVARETEVPLLLKTRPALADRAEAEIRRLHPYDCPPILRIAMEANADFLDWIREETPG
ncbi:divalent-cation tolerance protein CutA [Rhodosalinus sp.]|uniref:divalent-cation tolerance protein CutA n=1 Tax=Rhodosalinus sp. TaxID=2047741 RepID=UPI00356A8589